MNTLLAKLILAARDSDAKDAGWIQMLVVAIFVIVYALGSIIKAKANRAEQEDEEQEQARRPAGPMLRGQPRPQVQPGRTKVMRPEPVAQKFAAKKEQAIQLPTIEPLEVSKPPPLVALKEYKEFISKPFEKLEEKPIAIPAETPEAKYLAEILLDYADPDELKRAILHYEILGKPLSLRGPSEHIIGL